MSDHEKKPRDEMEPLTVTAPVGAGPPPVRVVKAPEDHVMSSIVSTVFCCWPIGIFAILRAMQCREAINRGNIQEAESLSLRARSLVRWTIGVGVFVYVLLFVLGFGIQFIAMFMQAGYVPSGLHRDGGGSLEGGDETSIQEKLDNILRILQYGSSTTASTRPWRD